MARLQPLPRWGRWFMTVVALGVVGLIAWGAWPKWSTATIGTVVVDGSELDISTDACAPRDVRTEVDEGTDAVTITVSVHDEPDNVDCSPGPSIVTLDAPLGDRLLVDGSDGTVLTCEPPGAATQECVR